MRVFTGGEWLEGERDSGRRFLNRDPDPLERERRERERQRERDTETERQRDTERERDRDGDRGRGQSRDRFLKGYAGWQADSEPLAALCERDSTTER